MLSENTQLQGAHSNPYTYSYFYSHLFIETITALMIPQAQNKTQTIFHTWLIDIYLYTIYIIYIDRYLTRQST